MIRGDDSGDTFKVDFDVLLQENPDTVAWIRFDEPSIISYPVVKVQITKNTSRRHFLQMIINLELFSWT